MATTTIPWDDGSGDNIYLTYSSASGDQTVEVSSDANTGSARSQTVTFTSEVGSITQQLTVNQDAGYVTQTFTANPSSYSGSSTTNAANGYTSETSTTYAYTRVSNSTSTLQSTYFIFNTSSIPQDAIILSVSCKAKVKMSGTNGITTRKIGLYSGTTAKGEESTMTGTLTTFSFSGATWTRAEVGNARVRYYTSKPASGNPPWVYFYGATLTVKYYVL